MPEWARPTLVASDSVTQVEKGKISSMSTVMIMRSRKYAKHEVAVYTPRAQM